MKKKLLLVARHPVGGIRTFIKYIYNLGYFDDYRITILITKNSLTDIFINSLKSENIDFILAKPSNIGLLIAATKYIAKNHIDIIHSHGFTSGFLIAPVARFFGIPHIMTVHDVLLQKQFTGIKGPIKRLALTYNYNTIDKIHAVSHDVSKNIIEFLPGIKKNNIVTILNGIDTSIFRENKTRDLRTELDIPQDFLIFGFVGRFMSQKGFIYIINAVEILYKKYGNNLNIKIVAIGSEGFIREDTDTIRKKGLQGFFTFLPPVDNISASINAFDAVLMPSLWEACPLVPMEALSMGRPLIASDCIGLREVISGTPAIKIRPADAISLADAMDRFMASPSSAAFEKYAVTARNRFECNKTAESISSLYESILDHAGKA